MTNEGGHRGATIIAVISAGATIIAAVIGYYTVLADDPDVPSDSSSNGVYNTPAPPEDVSISMQFSDDVLGWHQTYGGQTTVDIHVDDEHAGELCTCRGVYEIEHVLSEGSHNYHLEGTISSGQVSYTVESFGDLQAQDGRPFDVSFGADTNGDGWADELELDPLK
jgi:hypothetical protein